MATTVYDVCTVFTHADGTEGYKPLMLDPMHWAALHAQGLTTTLRHGFTHDEAEIAARLSLPILLAEFADFLAEGGTIQNRVERFFG